MLTKIKELLAKLPTSVKYAIGSALVAGAIWVASEYFGVEESTQPLEPTKAAEEVTK